MRVIVPYSPRDPKTRLDPVLAPAERQTFARLLLDDVLSVLERVQADPLVLSTDSVAVEVPVRVDQRSLSAAINALLHSAERPIAVVMADLGLLTPGTMDRLLAASGDIVIAPGRGGGTNALVVNHPEFYVDYHDGSYVDHLEIAATIGASVREVDSFRLATDIDEPDDLADLLVHGSGAASTYLAERGFELDDASGRTDIRRTSSPGSQCK